MDTARKATKRRTGLACHSCRARKVRCDVLAGAPCVNCRWDKIEVPNLWHVCFRPGTAGGPRNSPTKATATSYPPCQPPSSPEVAVVKRNTTSSSAALVTSGEANSLSNSFDDDDLELDTGQHSQASERLSPHQPSEPVVIPSCSPEWPWNPSLAIHADLFSNGFMAQLFNCPESSDVTFDIRLPAFIRPLPKKIAPMDAQYLQAKGALSLPTIPIQNALVQAYVEYVHPRFPLLDLPGLLHIMQRRDGLCEQMSLLLLHSVMYAGAAFADIESLHQAGYATRRAARRDLYQKARLLYNFDYEPDCLVVVQSLLLMAGWYETPDEQKDSWHWIGVAITLAQSIGLNCNPEESTQMSDSEKRLRKRVWWSCFMYDRLVALGLRFPTRINDDDFNVPMLVESDFDDQETLGCDTTFQQSSLAQDVGQQRDLATIFIARAKLCVHIGHVIQSQYSVLFNHEKSGNTTTRAMMLAPRKHLDNVESVNSIYSELCTWAESLPKCCHHQRMTTCDVENGKATIIQRILLQMEFHTAVSALYRPYFCLPLSLDVGAYFQARDTSRVLVRYAASRVTRLVTELQQVQLDRYLPTTGITIILSAAIIHLANMRNSSWQVCGHAMRDFRRCMSILEPLREIYAEAGYASSFLNQQLRSAAATRALLSRLPQ
ncbi:Cutinase transcription factor 1 beta [Tolypocladium paradoxum]|uniref:Cutinase transcription factor 1 beta n=1 Tax=Tolypocladium paradoxum TaxID=94208 RepID=A0A2S4KLA9_9HYPO|nr:Cutinase transcription factor 1 beta [Tolypocladium paradoxum]